MGVRREFWGQKGLGSERGFGGQRRFGGVREGFWRSETVWGVREGVWGVRGIFWGSGRVLELREGFWGSEGPGSRRAADGDKQRAWPRARCWHRHRGWHGHGAAALSQGKLRRFPSPSPPGLGVKRPPLTGDGSQLCVRLSVRPFPALGVADVPSRALWSLWGGCGRADTLAGHQRGLGGSAGAAGGSGGTLGVPL